MNIEFPSGDNVIMDLLRAYPCIPIEYNTYLLNIINDFIKSHFKRKIVLDKRHPISKYINSNLIEASANAEYSELDKELLMLLDYIKLPELYSIYSNRVYYPEDIEKMGLALHNIIKSHNLPTDMQITLAIDFVKYILSKMTLGNSVYTKYNNIDSTEDFRWIFCITNIGKLFNKKILNPYNEFELACYIYIVKLLSKNSNSIESLYLKICSRLFPNSYEFICSKISEYEQNNSSITEVFGMIKSTKFDISVNKCNEPYIYYGDIAESEIDPYAIIRFIRDREFNKYIPRKYDIRFYLSDNDLMNVYDTPDLKISTMRYKPLSNIDDNCKRFHIGKYKNELYYLFKTPYIAGKICGLSVKGDDTKEIVEFDCKNKYRYKFDI